MKLSNKFVVILYESGFFNLLHDLLFLSQSRVWAGHIVDSIDLVSILAGTFALPAPIPPSSTFVNEERLRFILTPSRPRPLILDQLKLLAEASNLSTDDQRFDLRVASFGFDAS